MFSPAKNRKQKNNKWEDPLDPSSWTIWPGGSYAPNVGTKEPQGPVNSIQHGGDHYKKYGDLQPWDVVVKWNLGYLDGTALKYIARWRDKGGIEDLRKAIHFLEKLIEVEHDPARNTTSR